MPQQMMLALVMAISTVSADEQKTDSATKPARDSNRYRFRQTADFQKLSRHEQRALNRVIADFDRLGKAIGRYMADHESVPPASLELLVPEYLERLPTDPFAAATAREKKSPQKGLKFRRSLGGRGYEYRARPQPTYAAWQIRSSGLTEFPLRFRPSVKHSRGLVRSEGYWGRLLLDVF